MDVAWIALIVATISAVFSALSAIVAWRNRADGRRVSFLLEGVGNTEDGADGFQYVYSWRLRNTGNRPVLDPAVTVTGVDETVTEITGVGLLEPGKVMDLGQTKSKLSVSLVSNGEARVEWYDGYDGVRLSSRHVTIVGADMFAGYMPQFVKAKRRKRGQRRQLFFR